MAAVQNGWLDEKAVMMESLTCMKRAGTRHAYFTKAVSL